MVLSCVENARRLAIGVVAALSIAGCAARVGPTLEDAETAMRAKTAVLNDPEVGTEDVRLDVIRGVAYLTGSISSDDRRQRLVQIVRGTPGVRDVEVSLDVRPEMASLRPRVTIEPDAPGRRRLVALGASVRVFGSTAPALDDAVDVAPVIRLGSREGWGPAVGFEWSSRTLEEGPTGDPPLARLQVRPIMGGVSYTRQVGRASASASLVAGYAFNSLSIDRSIAGANRALAVSNTPAWRPSATLWFDVAERTALQFSVGYLWARPRVTFGSDDQLRTVRVRADGVSATVGAIYWVF